MSAFTKKAIMASFFKLLEKNPLDKITVKSITDDCGVNRNTFYYYYQDIYELLEDIFMQEAEKTISEMSELNSWQDGLCVGLKFIIENKRVVFHAYNSLGRETVERFLYKVTDDFLIKFVCAASSDLTVSDSDKEFIADFYKIALTGIFLDWLESGMKTEPQQLINRISVIFKDTLRHALINADTAENHDGK